MRSGGLCSGVRGVDLGNCRSSLLCGRTESPVTRNKSGLVCHPEIPSGKNICREKRGRESRERQTIVFVANGGAAPGSQTVKAEARWDFHPATQWLPSWSS